MNQKLIVLDIDETLVYASEERLPDIAHSFEIPGFYVYKRPYLDEFLAHCFRLFRVAVWSQSHGEYVAEVVRQIMPEGATPDFVWGGDRCTFVTNPYMRQYYWVKDIKKILRLGYRREEIIIVDDTPRKIERSYGNLVRVSPFTRSPDDDELQALMLYLERLAGESNVRRIEKRGWRSREG